MSVELKPGEFLITRDSVSTKHRLAPDQSWPRSWPLMIGPTDCRGEPLDLGPATRSDLAELDAVPEPVDSDAPREVFVRTVDGPCENCPTLYLCVPRRACQRRA